MRVISGYILFLYVRTYECALSEHYVMSSDAPPQSSPLLQSALSRRVSQAGPGSEVHAMVASMMHTHSVGLSGGMKPTKKKTPKVSSQSIRTLLYGLVFTNLV